MRSRASRRLAMIVLQHAAEHLVADDRLGRRRAGVFWECDDSSAGGCLCPGADEYYARLLELAGLDTYAYTVAEAEAYARREQQRSEARLSQEAKRPVPGQK